MNTFIQIGIGLLSFALLSLIIILVKKIRRFKPIFFSSVMVVGSLGFLAAGVVNIINGSSDGNNDSKIQKRQMLNLAYAFVSEGSKECAEKVIDQYDEMFEYDDDRRLLEARMCMIDGEYEKACGIYSALNKGSVQKAFQTESELAEKLTKYDSSDIPTIMYLIQNNKTPADYGYDMEISEIEDALGISQQEIADTVQKGISSSIRIPDDYIECARTVMASENILNGNNTEAVVQNGELLKKIIKKNDELYEVDMIEELVLISDTISGNYNDIVKLFGDESSPLCDMIVSELYINGLVSNRTIRKTISVDKDKAKKIADALEKLADKYSDDEDIESRAENLVEVLDNNASAIIMNILRADIEKNKDSYISKLFLSMAKIENFNENYAAAKVLIQKSIDASLPSDDKDDKYNTAMTHIRKTIANESDSDTEDIKNVPNYVESAVKNVLPNGLNDRIEKAGEAYRAEMNQDADLPDKKDPDDSADIYDAEDEEETVPVDFSQSFEEKVMEVKSAISIGTIDVSSFETVRAAVQISADTDDIDELKKQLVITDCGIEIEDFTIKKLEYERSNILLLCDVSGSMEKSQKSLIDAVKEFVNTHGKNETLSLVTFNDKVKDVAGFGSSDKMLLDAADKINANGGTNMYSSALSCLSYFKKNIRHNNIIILMTDGQDNSPRSADTIRTELGLSAQDCGVRIYTLGLGQSVDTNYLTTIAKACQGDFVYVSDEQMLKSFYNMLHGQVDSQYEIEFKAQDTLSQTNRNLTVSFRDSLAKDSKLYDIGEDSLTKYKLSRDLYVSGFVTKRLYNISEDYENTLKGTGFKKEYNISVKLSGDMSYDLEAEYKDETSYSVIIPSGVASGIYDIEISINGRKTIIRNGFGILDSSEMKEIKVGPYRFTALTSTTSVNGDITLSGSVTMNEWLCFNGDVTFYNYSEDAGSVKIYDAAGSFVMFDSSTAEGIVGKLLAKNSIPVAIPPLEELKLYNDPSSGRNYSDYFVDIKPVSNIFINDLLRIFSPSVSLYPDRFELEYTAVTTLIPFQNDIFPNICSKFKLTPLFNFDSSFKGIVTNKNIETIIDVNFESNRSEPNYKNITAFGSAFGIDLGEFRLLFDTLDEKFELKFKVGLDFIPKVDGFTFGIGTVEFIKPDWLEIGADFNVTGAIYGIPVTFSNFGYKAENLSSVIENHNFADVKISGSFDFDIAKLDELIPALDKIFEEDISLIGLHDTTATMYIWPPGITGKTTAKLFGIAEIAGAEVGIGHYDYSNSLLGIDEEKITGINVKFINGFKFDVSQNFSVANYGSGEYNIHSRFMGLSFSGETSYALKFWGLSTESKVTGDFALGLYFARNGEKMLIFKYRTQDSDGKVNDETYYMKSFSDVGKYKGQLL